ncbi:hypothetical protein LV89_01076 [Arcicella aurantiaca]|uniref:Uncharacterized protein n=1 Tax=Arcicella aurantiaca TaxID=591202 RepID=A0A316EHM1_9BACT|nr:hypothetical protein [Arcicella aurantiaca]PWK28293.1 hypothetical protein LV89_01076 [Arcicella aurantiaca]
MRSSKLILAIISILAIAQSCTHQKGYFTVVSQTHAVKSTIQPEVKPNVVPTVATVSETPSIESVKPTLVASNSEVVALENAVKNTKYEKEVKQFLAKVEQPSNEVKANTKVVKMNFAQKIIFKKLQKKMANTAKPSGFRDLSPFLKIGLILLGIGIVLAIFGLGVVGGLAAFIGLAFTILGLIGSV